MVDGLHVALASSPADFSRIFPPRAFQSSISPQASSASLASVTNLALYLQLFITNQNFIYFKSIDY